jgi:hypothetical protein
VESRFTPPSPAHIDFDLLCLEVEEFEPLPSLTVQDSEPESERVESSSLDGLILAGLVTP